MSWTIIVIIVAISAGLLITEFLITRKPQFVFKGKVKNDIQNISQDSED